MSQFTLDPFGRMAKIVETVSGSVMSTKQFVWAGWAPCETRDGTGALTAQFFVGGESVPSASYFFSGDHLGSVREMTNFAGTIVEQRVYDSYGREGQIQSSVPADFRFAGHYEHARSGLNITYTRAYSSALGRFINRDLIEESAGPNLFSDVLNNSINFSDPSGLQQYDSGNSGGVGAGANPGTGGGTSTGGGASFGGGRYTLNTGLYNDSLLPDGKIGDIKTPVNPLTDPNNVAPDQVDPNRGKF